MLQRSETNEEENRKEPREEPHSLPDGDHPPSYAPAQVSDVIIDLGGTSVCNLSVRSLGVAGDRDLSLNSHINRRTFSFA